MWYNVDYVLLKTVCLTVDSFRWMQCNKDISIIVFLLWQNCVLLSVYISVCESECLIDALSNRECCCRQLHVLIISYGWIDVCCYVWRLICLSGCRQWNSESSSWFLMKLAIHFPCCYKWLTSVPILAGQEAAKTFCKDNISRSTKFSRKTHRGQGTM